MAEPWYRKIEEFAPAEVANTALGVAGGAFGHMLLESALDNFFKPKYPENYWIYSTGITSAVFLAIAIGLYLYGRKPGYEFFQYIAGGILLAELVQLLDMIHVSFVIRGE